MAWDVRSPVDGGIDSPALQSHPFGAPSLRAGLSNRRVLTGLPLGKKQEGPGWAAFTAEMLLREG